MRWMSRRRSQKTGRQRAMNQQGGEFPNGTLWLVWRCTTGSPMAVFDKFQRSGHCHSCPAMPAMPASHATTAGTGTALYVTRPRDAYTRWVTRSTCLNALNAGISLYIFGQPESGARSVECKLGFMLRH